MNPEDPRLVQVTRELVLDGFEPRFGSVDFEGAPVWARVCELGSEPWLDTGDIDAATDLWCREFKALTTNNTLLNKEVQKGTYDGLVGRAVKALRAAFPRGDEAFLVREVAFVLNAYHGLRLVEKFDAFVSVEEHTDLAHDADGATAYARRFHAICPERFFVKIPLTAEGLVAARQVGREGIPVNLTLGFSARQNLLVTAVARPSFCNVFLGRLNQVVVSHALGDGRFVGEKASAASQRAVRHLRETLGVGTRQIAASIRTGEQVPDLLGTDVLTIPPKAASEFADACEDPAALERTPEEALRPQWASGADPGAWGLPSLWEVPDGLEETAREIGADVGLDGPGLLRRLAEAGFGPLLPDWSDAAVAAAAAAGKMPDFSTWRDRLASGEIGLDALMNLHGLHSFAADQRAMDDRIRGLM